ncbi:M1 family aminopeptidase [Flaviaesturariibacter terrae]
MKSFLFAGALCLSASSVLAQFPASATAQSTVYRSTAEKINDLVHTKLDARFDFANAQLQGNVWITLKPHFYPTDSLRLDAKGMEIREVSLLRGGAQTPVKYTYDGEQLNIRLGRTFRNNEPYTVYIAYVAKPNDYQAKGSAAITDAKGLYFINPKGEEPGKPTQVWTQGETEATSVWVPTIDKPNQKTTEEILMTVPAKYLTLSNGLLVKQTKNADGTRTDEWKMDLPHAPYLFFMGIGDYSVTKDQYKGKEVSYYVEKEYASVARRIFGNTPEMMAYFSRITGVEFPWAKYAQIVGRDYVSGAMENTTATLHQESAQQDARELSDGNEWESTIAHELFHQWFGDLVTAESWSNLTLNESFANYSEYLWTEYKYGKDAADAHNQSDLQGYLGSAMMGSEKKDLVRFHYNDKEDMFDAVSYNKGGRILHMLRNYVGDSAFFKSLNLYLSSNKFKSAEAQQLRLAFEEVTGKDLNWFWNQWYYGSGHPKLDINYSYDEAARQVRVIVQQKQTGDKIFTLPVAIDVYNGPNRVRHQVWVDAKADTFVFAAAAKPDLVNFDADKILLGTKTENKTVDEYVHQYKYAGNYVDRREALEYAARHQEDPKAMELLLSALNDRYEGLRAFAASRVDLKKEAVKTAAEAPLAKLASSDPKRSVKAAAIAKLADYKKPSYAALFRKAVNDSSYAVAGNALDALNKVDSAAALTEARRLSKDKAKGKLASTITNILLASGDASASERIVADYIAMPPSQEKFNAQPTFIKALARTEDAQLFRKAVDDLYAFMAIVSKQVPEEFRAQAFGPINEQLADVVKAQRAAGRTQLADYLDQKLAKKTF